MSDDKPRLSAVPDAQPANDTDDVTPADQPTPEQIIETMAQAILANIGPALVYAPMFPQERLPDVARFLAAEQFKINTEILPRFADPDEAHPCFAIKFTRLADVAPGETMHGVQIEAIRRLEGITEPDDACKMALLYAFLDSPNARAILRMNQFAYTYSFVGRPKPRIVV